MVWPLAWSSEGRDTLQTSVSISASRAYRIRLSYLVNEPVNLNNPSTSSNSENPTDLNFGFPVIVIPEDTRDSAPIVRVFNEARLLKVKAPFRVSRSGAMSFVSPDTPSAIKEPLISSTLLIVIAPFTDEEIVMLPSKLSQLLRLSASL